MDFDVFFSFNILALRQNGPHFADDIFYMNFDEKLRWIPTKK